MATLNLFDDSLKRAECSALQRKAEELNDLATRKLGTVGKSFRPRLRKIIASINRIHTRMNGLSLKLDVDWTLAEPEMDAARARLNVLETKVKDIADKWERKIRLTIGKMKKRMRGKTKSTVGGDADIIDGTLEADLDLTAADNLEEDLDIPFAVDPDLEEDLDIIATDDLEEDLDMPFAVDPDLEEDLDMPFAVDPGMEDDLVLPPPPAAPILTGRPSLAPFTGINTKPKKDDAMAIIRKYRNNPMMRGILAQAMGGDAVMKTLLGEGEAAPAVHHGAAHDEAKSVKKNDSHAKQGTGDAHGEKKEGKDDNQKNPEDHAGDDANDDKNAKKRKGDKDHKHAKAA